MSFAPESPTSSPEGGSSRPNPLWMWGAVAFLAIVLVMAAMMAVFSTRDTQPQNTPAQAPTSASELPAPVPVDPGKGFATPITDRWGNRIEIPVNKFGQVLPQDASAQLKPDDAGWTSQPAKGVMWQLVYNFPIPFSTSDGPTKIEGKVATGYAHTPQGAVLAGIDAMARCSAMGGNVAYECWKHRMTGDHLYRDLEERVQLLGQGPSPRNTANTTPPMAWVKVLNYADDYMAFELAHVDMDNPDTYDVYLVEMVWVDGDWKIKANNNGKTAKVGVTSLDGFTRW